MKYLACIIVFGALGLTGGSAQAADTVTAGSAVVGTHPGYGSYYAGFWKAGADYSLLTDGNHTFLNAPGTPGGNIFFRFNNNFDMAAMNTGQFAVYVPQVNYSTLDIQNTLTVNGYMNVNAPLLVRITNGGTALTGISANGLGVLGSGTNAYGVKGSSNYIAGVYGTTSDTHAHGAAGVWGDTDGSATGVKGSSSTGTGVEGRSASLGGWGGMFSGGGGIIATANGDGTGVQANGGSVGVYASGWQYAVDAQGPMRVTGRLGTGGEVAVGSNLTTGGNVTVGFNLTVSGNHAYKSGSATWESTSDQRVKKDVVDFKQGLALLAKIRPVRFKYNGLGETPNNGVEYVGVIAQELEKAAPFMVSSQKKLLHSDDKEKTDIKQIDPGAFTYMLINAVQELSKQNGEMKKVICREHPSESFCTSTN